MTKTAVSAPAPEAKPLYVYLLEETVRRLERVVGDCCGTITPDQPHGLPEAIVEIVTELRGAR